MHHTNGINIQKIMTRICLHVTTTLWPESSSELYLPRDRRLSAKLVLTFADRGSHVVSVTDPYGRILGFLDRVYTLRYIICCFFDPSLKTSRQYLKGGEQRFLAQDNQNIHLSIVLLCLKGWWKGGRRTCVATDVICRRGCNFGMTSRLPQSPDSDKTVVTARLSSCSTQKPPLLGFFLR
jgi:hypothetical protein